LNGKFGCQKVTSEKEEKIMNKINVKKATGAATVAKKLLKRFETSFELLIILLSSHNIIF
jgi:hypothetical protein